MIQNNLRTPQLVGFACQLGCKNSCRHHDKLAKVPPNLLLVSFPDIYTIGDRLLIWMMIPEHDLLLSNLIGQIIDTTRYCDTYNDSVAGY